MTHLILVTGAAGDLVVEVLATVSAYHRFVR
ncbi:hypothetical protein SAMN05444166_7666 [Singulisphaera sp. GP187]|nr:hypothetical protein SAMN05444166_7666 [Singulisphaera sp. GP187]